MADEDDALEGEETASGEGAAGGLPDEGIEGEGEDSPGDEDTAAGEAGPSSGTTEGDDAVGPV